MIYCGKQGYLKIIIGSMFSGKTSELIAISRLYQVCNISCCIINFNEDTRYSKTMLSTHDQIMVPCISTPRLTSVVENMQIYKVILINEAQFFPDLYDIVKNLIEKYKKIVYICGLDGDYKRCKFGQILDLVPLCDEIVKKQALCMICRIPACVESRK